MNFLELIAGTADRKPVPVPTPEWPAADGKIFVRRLSTVERVAFYTEADKQRSIAGAAFQAFVVAFCACKENGERGFASDAWKSLQEEPGSVIERIADAADELNVLSNTAKENIKKKYSQTQPSEATCSSPEKTE